MKRLLIAAALLILCLDRSPAQSLDDLNIQLHGYATQGVLYTTHNNWNTTNSSDGSAAWTEAVVNLSAQPESRMHIGIQARYFLLGTYGNTITLDWAQADYKVNERFGIRAGKVKTPVGLFNDTQDIDPAQLWVLLPQSVYPLSSRNSILAHYGFVTYGSVPLGESIGKLEYHAFAGSRVLGGDDGFFQPLRDAGLTLPNGISGPLLGGGLTWHTPLHGLKFGASYSYEHPSGQVVAGPLQGKIQITPLKIPYFFGKYEGKRLMVASEYNRTSLITTVQFPNLPSFLTPVDVRGFYLMTTYKITEKLSGGLYYSSAVNRQSAFNSNRYQKDWTVAGRYDFNAFLYLKLEQHFMDGTELGYSTTDNSGGLNPTTRMSLAKLGVSF